jgi:mxaJ protein
MPPALLVLAVLAMASAAASAESLYVSDEARDLVHVVDTGTGTVVTTIAAGRRPRGLGLSPDGATLYVATSDDDRIAIVDARTGRVTGALPSGPDPERFALDRTGRRLYVANEDDALMSIVDVRDRRSVGEVAVGPEPEGVAISPDGRTAVATSESAATAHFVDAASATTLDTVLVHSRPRFALFEPDGRRVWISSETRGTVTVIDVATRGIVGVVDFEAAEPAGGVVQPVGLAMTRDGRRLFVALGRGNRVAEVEPASRRIVRYFTTGSRTWHVALGGDESRLYAANGLSGDVTVIDLVANRVGRTIPIGGKPWDVTVGPWAAPTDPRADALRPTAEPVGSAPVRSVAASVERPARVLRVCADPNNLPFSNERREGFENRIVELLARDLGLEVEYTWWAQRRGYVRNTLGAGRCDVIPGVASGLEMVRTTRPYYRSTYVFVNRADRHIAAVDSFDDARLHRLRVGVQLVGDDGANTPPSHALARRGIVANVRGFPLYGDYATPNPPTRIVEAVARGDVDVAIVWGPLAGWYATQSDVPLELRPVRPWLDAARLPMVFDVSMGVRRDDPALRRRLDDALQRNRVAVDRVLAEYGVPRP